MHNIDLSDKPSLGIIIKIFFLSAIFLINSADAQICATAGQDGPTNAGSSINTYYPVSGAVTLSAGSKSIMLAAVPVTDSHGNNFGTTQISAGDLLLIIQIQDASISFTNSTLYGANSSTSGTDGLGGTGSTSIGNSGKFEFLVATSNVPLTGGMLTFKGAGTTNGTVNTYINADPTATQGKKSFQILRITQYSNLKLTSNISPPPFNGSVGGIIAFDVAGTMDFNGYNIDVSAKGFRGGYSLKKASTSNYNNIYVALATDDRVSGKGEGIAGTPRYMWDGYNQIDNIIEGLPGGSAGMGAPGNAGGGGNDSNAGGGGGGNGGYGGVGGWGYAPLGGSFPNGGRPGSSMYTAEPPDVTRLTMGGGGGGGHANDALTGVKGGVGGGIVLINAATIIGNGTILANGGNGAPGAFGGNPDGSGGGGAGGTVFIKVSTPDPLATITINTKGGAGGDTEGDPGGGGVQPHGPGGGGGGGIIMYAIASGTVNTDISNGLSGRTNSGAGIQHNAEDGRAGTVQIFNIAGLPPYLQAQGSVCYPQLVTTMTEANPPVAKSPGGTATYTITITNTATDGNAGGVQVDCLLPAGFSFQSATVLYTGAAGGPATITNSGTATRPMLGNFNISPGDAVNVTLVAGIDCGAPAGTYNSSAQAIYLDPTRTITAPNRTITAAVSAFVGSNTTYQSNGVTVPGSNYNGAASADENVTVTTISPISNNFIAQPHPDGIFCSGSANPSVIGGNVPSGGTGVYSYQWQSSTDNITFTDIPAATAIDYNPTIINTTTYYRRIATSSNCIASLNSNIITVTMGSPVTNNIIVTPAVTKFCITGNPTIINGNVPAGGTGTYNYQWQSSADNINFTTITGATGKDYDPPVINVTTYYRRAVNTSVCVIPANSNVVKITIDAIISNNTITMPAINSFCSTGDPAAIIGSTPIGGNGTYSYQWQSSNDNIIFADIVGAFLKDYDPPIITTTTYYRRVVTSGTCTALGNTIKLTIDTPPIGVISSDVTVCEGGSTVLSASGGASYLWSPTAGLSGATTANPTANPTTTTTYSVIIAKGNCNVTKTVTVTVIPKPFVDAGTDIEITEGDKIQLNGKVSGSLHYSWSPALYLDDPTSLTPVASPLTDITYTLTSTTEQGCFVISDNVFIRVYQKVVVPNTFTPNGDGINDTWEINKVNTYPNCVVSVFTRSGTEVFKSIGYNKAWDGTYNGKSLPFGTYYYTIDLKNRFKSLSGWVAIIK